MEADADMDIRKKGNMLVFVAVFLWSVAGLQIKTVGASAVWIAFIKNLTGGLFLSIFIFKEKIGPIKNVLFATISMVLFTLLFTLTTQKSTAAMAISMQYSAPMYMGIITAIKAKEMKKNKFIVLALIFIGIILNMLSSLKSSNYLAIFMGLGIGVTFLLYTINIHKIDKGAPLGIVALINLISSVIYLAILIYKPDGSPSNLKDIASLTISGIVISGLSYALYGSGVRMINIERAMIIGLAEPILNPVWVYLGTGEIPDKINILGASFILLGAIMDIVLGKREKEMDIKEKGEETEGTDSIESMDKETEDIVYISNEEN